MRRAFLIGLVALATPLLASAQTDRWYSAKLLGQYRDGKFQVYKITQHSAGPGKICILFLREERATPYTPVRLPRDAPLRYRSDGRTMWVIDQDDREREMRIWKQALVVDRSSGRP